MIAHLNNQENRKRFVVILTKATYDLGERREALYCVRQHRHQTDDGGDKTSLIKKH